MPMSSRNDIVYLLLFIFFLALLAACTDERKVANRLDGIWTVTSFQGRQDSLETDFFEFIGPLFSGAILDFGNYNLSDSEGIYEFTIIDATNDLSDKDAGTYMLSEDGQRLTLIRLDGTDVLAIDVGNEKLYIEGPYLGSTVKIEAELR